MPQTHTLTWATPAANFALADVMFDAVRTGSSKYTDAQRAAWVPVRRSGAEWEARLAKKNIAIGCHGDRILGFMSIERGGYIDFAFIRPEAQGSGLFRRLYDMVEARARAGHEPRLWVHASLMAQPAFAAMGFSVVAHEIVQIGGQEFKRAMMEKTLIYAE